LKYTAKQQAAIVRAAEHFVRAELRRQEAVMNGRSGREIDNSHRDASAAEGTLVRTVMNAWASRAKPARAAGRRKR
jgi:hypothetical protein